MYLFACRIKIKIKWLFSTFIYKILYLTILVVCRKSPSQSDHTNCKTITIEEEEKVFLVGYPDCCQCLEIQYKLGG
jgi:hypothetical protein